MIQGLTGLHEGKYLKNPVGYATEQQPTLNVLMLVTLIDVSIFIQNSHSNPLIKMSLSKALVTQVWILTSVDIWEH